MESPTFEDYYNEFKHAIYSYLYYRCGRNRELAEDLTSEIFIKALEKFHTYDPEKKFKSWIFTIAHNHLIDHFRQQRTTVDLETVENIIEGDTEDVKQILNQRIAAEQVTELLDKVSDEEKEILLMRYHQGMPIKNIADLVDREEGHVRVIIHRALAKMQKQYGVLFTSMMLLLALGLL